MSLVPLTSLHDCLSLTTKLLHTHSYDKHYDHTHWDWGINRAWHLIHSPVQVLPRILTTNELKILPLITKHIVKNILNGTSSCEWLFTNILENLLITYRGWIRPNGRWHMAEGEPITLVNNTYALVTKRDRLYFITTVGGRVKVCYQKYRADRHSVQSRKRLEGHHILTDLDNLLVEKVSCLIRDKLIELWCRVPTKKGTQLKTIAKKLLEFIPSENLPSQELQEQFNTEILHILDLSQQQLREDKITRKKNAGQKIYAAVDFYQQQLEALEEKQTEQTNLEEARLKILEDKYKKQQENLKNLQEKQKNKLNKIINKLHQAQYTRTAILLSSVCKSMNNVCKTPEYKTKMKENPLVNISATTFAIVNCLINSKTN